MCSFPQFQLEVYRYIYTNVEGDTRLCETPYEVFGLRTQTAVVRLLGGVGAGRVYHKEVGSLQFKERGVLTEADGVVRLSNPAKGYEQHDKIWFFGGRLDRDSISVYNLTRGREMHVPVYDIWWVPHRELLSAKRDAPNRYLTLCGGQQNVYGAKGMRIAVTQTAGIPEAACIAQRSASFCDGYREISRERKEEAFRVVVFASLANVYREADDKAGDAAAPSDSDSSLMMSSFSDLDSEWTATDMTSLSGSDGQLTPPRQRASPLVFEEKTPRHAFEDIEEAGDNAFYQQDWQRHPFPQELPPYSSAELAAQASAVYEASCNPYSSNPPCQPAADQDSPTSMDSMSQSTAGCDDNPMQHEDQVLADHSPSHQPTNSNIATPDRVDPAQYAHQAQTPPSITYGTPRSPSATDDMATAHAYHSLPLADRASLDGGGAPDGRTSQPSMFRPLLHPPLLAPPPPPTPPPSCGHGCGKQLMAPWPSDASDASDASDLPHAHDPYSWDQDDARVAQAEGLLDWTAPMFLPC